MSGYPTPLQKIGQSLLCTGSSTQLQNLHIPVPTIQYMQNNLNMSKNASWAHKLLLIISIIITILQLSPNNSIVDNTFVLYKHILKSTILIHVVSKNHQATNRLLQNQPQNDHFVPPFSELIFGTTSAVHFHHFSTHTTYGT